MSSATAANVKSAPLAWFARHELRLAWREWLSMMNGGARRATPAHPCRHHRLGHLCRRDASAGLGGGRAFCDLASAPRQILADRAVGDHLLGLGLDALAGHRIR